LNDVIEFNLKKKKENIINPINCWKTLVRLNVLMRGVKVSVGDDKRVDDVERWQTAEHLERIDVKAVVAREEDCKLNETSLK